MESHNGSATVKYGLIIYPFGRSWLSSLNNPLMTTTNLRAYKAKGKRYLNARNVHGCKTFVLEDIT